MDAMWNIAPLLLLALWLALQVAALNWMTGAWRIAALVPAFALGAAFAIAIMGVLAGSNIAPIWVVLAFPLCLAWLAVLWVLRGIAGLLAS